MPTPHDTHGEHIPTPIWRETRRTEPGERARTPVQREVEEGGLGWFYGGWWGSVEPGVCTRLGASPPGGGLGAPFGVLSVALR